MVNNASKFRHRILVLEKKLFYTYLKKEKQLNSESLAQLKEITTQYPYFESAQLMLLKNMQEEKDDSFNAQLKKTAITCCDRATLFYYLNNERYARFFASKKREQTSENDRTEVLLDSFLDSLNKKEKKTEESIPEPLNEWDNQSIISTDYLAYLEQTEDEGTSLANKKDAKPMKHQELLDNFLEKSSNEEELFSSKKRERKETPAPPQSVDSLLDSDSFLTETLAQVYIKQKKYEQALTIIKRLSLNFPEKSIYFADQIRFLEYLIYNEKNKK